MKSTINKKLINKMFISVKQFKYSCEIDFGIYFGKLFYYKYNDIEQYKNLLNLHDH
jgi:hypothetical protein